jgi:large subunit ribosomal protein L7/L12
MEETKSVEIPAKFAAIVKQIEEMSVLDLNELVKLFEAKFGVSATAAAAPAAAAAAVEEKDSFTVVLASFGDAKIPVMKVVKEALGLGLKEAKDLVDAVPSNLKEGMKKAEAEDLKKKIEEAGGKVELK